MLVITMRRKTINGEPIGHDALRENGEDYTDWWCAIETKEEEIVYEEFVDNPDKYGTIWNAMVRHAGQGMGVSWGDDDIYGYIYPDEMMPEIGEEFTDGDSDVWERIE